MAWDAFNGDHMGVTAENVARQWQLSRGEQDAFAVASQQKAEAAWKTGRFKEEIVPVTVAGRKGDTVVDTDEHFKPGTSLDSLGKLRPAFAKDGTVTAGNASGLNDGAAALILMTARNAARRSVEPLGQEGLGHAVHRRRHGDRALCRAPMMTTPVPPFAVRCDRRRQCYSGQRRGCPRPAGRAGRFDDRPPAYWAFLCSASPIAL